LYRSFAARSVRVSRPTCATCAIKYESVPNAFAVLVSAYTPSPSIAAPTTTTLATPMIIPSNVNALRNLCAHIESAASCTAVVNT
jgi:hypothetical protein